MRLGKWLVLALILLNAIPFLSATASGTTPMPGCNYYFIIYGEEWCPHCQNMKAFVESYYGGSCLEFRGLEVQAWKDNFTAVVEDLQKQGIPIQAAFPLTGILVNGTLKVIVQGEATSIDTIDYMVRTAETGSPGKIAVFIGGQYYPATADNVLLEAYTPGAYTPQENAVSKARNDTLIALGAVLVAAGLAMLAFVFARK